LIAGDDTILAAMTRRLPVTLRPFGIKATGQCLTRQLF
jgi:hypothetical protein